jgi:hypothetical protein
MIIKAIPLRHKTPAIAISIVAHTGKIDPPPPFLSFFARKPMTTPEATSKV